jgi:hypothetical protein
VTDGYNYRIGNLWQLQAELEATLEQVPESFTGKAKVSSLFSQINENITEIVAAFEEEKTKLTALNEITQAKIADLEEQI